MPEQLIFCGLRETMLEMFCELIYDHKLYQLIDLPTHHLGIENILDLLPVTSPDIITQITL